MGTENEPCTDCGDKVMRAASMPLGVLSFVGEIIGPELADDTVTLVAAAMERLGSPWGIAQTDDGFVVLGSAEVRWQVDSYTEGVARIAEQLAQDGERPVLAERWRSDMAFEGVDTGDGRYINPGAIGFRDCPLPLMLQTETAPGHMGAVLAGTIEQTGMMGSTAVGSGSFDDSEAGKQSVGIIQARGRFGVSIDVAEAEGEFVCTERDAEGDCTDGRMEFSLIKIMGNCYDDQTEILTEERGWQRFADLSPDDRVATRNKKTAEFEWQQPTFYSHTQWEGPMIRFKGRNLDLLVTPNHRMLVEPRAGGPIEVLAAEELALEPIGKWRIPLTSAWDVPDVATIRIPGREPQPEGLCACGCGNAVLPRTQTLGVCSVDGCGGPAYSRGMCNPHYQRWFRLGDPTLGGPMRPSRANKRIDSPPVTLPGHGHGYGTEDLVLDADDFAAFMGAWLAEGSCGGDRRVAVSQLSASKGFAMYEALFGRLFANHYHDGKSFRATSVGLRRYLQQFGHASDKFVPDLIKDMSVRQLRIFLDFYLAGDGSHEQRGNSSRWRSSTVSSRLAGDLQEIAQKVGISASVRTHTKKGDQQFSDGRIIKTENCQPIHIVAFRSSRYAGKWVAERVDDYVGDVRCVTVPNETLYVRRNGYPAWCCNTLTPFPAFENAYIEIPQTAEQGIAASGSEPSEDEPKPKPVDTHTDAPLPLGKEDPIPLGKQEPNELSAAGGPAAPTKAWFENPNFDVDDPAHDGRLVPQPNGGWACPLTVLDNGRVFGHMAPADGPTWRSAPGTAGRTCHTGYVGKCVPPPRSASGYAAFMLRPLMTAEGEVVRVGYITAGCGHLYESRPVEQVRAHYDGGPNAVRMAAICVGEDDFGIWFAGSLCPDVTDEQVRAFAATSVSGDWREVWRGKGLDLVACLGGVTVPGFPVASIAAGAAPFALAEAEPKMAWEDGRPVMLVAAGAVRQPLAWERALAERDSRIDALEERLARAERVAQPLRRLAADAMVDGIEVATATN